MLYRINRHGNDIADSVMDFGAFSTGERVRRTLRRQCGHGSVPDSCGLVVVACSGETGRTLVGPAAGRRAAYDSRVSANDEIGQRVVYVLRHGETEWSANGRHTGVTDVPLTAEGVQQARRAGIVLSRLRGTDVPPTLVLSSPRQRALRTAELAGLHVDEVTEELAEWDYGDYEGLTTSEVRQKVPNWTIWSHPVPGGESGEHVGERASKLLDRVNSAMSEGDVVLIGHGHFSRVLIARWLELSTADGVRFALDPAGITMLGSERGERQVLRSNVPSWRTNADDL